MVITSVLEANQNDLPVNTVGDWERVPTPGLHLPHGLQPSRRAPEVFQAALLKIWGTFGEAKFCPATSGLSHRAITCLLYSASIWRWL